VIDAIKQATVLRFHGQAWWYYMGMPLKRHAVRQRH
jgi:hypothetical protein